MHGCPGKASERGREPDRAVGVMGPALGLEAPDQLVVRRRAEPPSGGGAACRHRNVRDSSIVPSGSRAQKDDVTYPRHRSIRQNAADGAPMNKG